MQRKSTLWIALALAVLMPAVALAGPGFGPRGERGGPGGGGPGGGGPGGHFLPPPGYLDLTDEQIDAVQVIRDNVREQLQVLHQDHAALREQLRELLDGDAPDPAAVGELVIELHSERGQVREVLEVADAELSALLTPEQLVKWENFKELRRSRRGPAGPGGRGSGGRGPGGPGGPGGGFGGPGFGGPPGE